MRLRLILLVLSLLAFLSTSAGGFLYYSSLKDAAIREAQRLGIRRSEMIRKHLSAFLSENSRPIKVLAGLTEMRRALSGPDGQTLAGADAVLDYFRSTLHVEVCYLIDASGKTIASSNRNEADSFVGQDFDFRPYFKESMAGKQATYLALGTTSKKRGVYTSSPVFGPEGGGVLGVVVIKESIEQIEKELALIPEESVILADPLGVIFISSRKDWLFKTIRRLSPEEAARIASSKQFGEGAFEGSGLQIESGSGSATDVQGARYVAHEAEMDGYPGWRLFFLQSYAAVSKIIYDPLIRITGYLTIILCVFIGVSVAVFYRKASKEIARRKAAEQALSTARDELSRYSRDLERQVRRRTEEITSILNYTPDVVYIKDTEGRYLMVNPRYEEIFGVRSADIRGKRADEFLPRELAEEFQMSDQMALVEQRSCQVENQIPRGDGVHTYLSVKFPIYDESGQISGVGGISTDITELKKAQIQLRRLSGSVIASQEKERAVIARELHDELGQMLTALRMDAVWITRHLNKIDPKSEARALTMCRLIDQTIEDVRGIAIRLRPGVLDDLGLVDALEWYAADFERRAGITCIFDRGAIPAVPNTLATAAYRITQEALTNIARHAGASRVHVILKAEDDILTITILDDGRGFDTAILDESRGLGIAGMRERAALVGGTIEVQSLPGEGCRVCFRVDLSPRNLEAFT